MNILLRLNGFKLFVCSIQMQMSYAVAVDLSIHYIKDRIQDVRLLIKF
jgi:hypothetical protein